MKALQVTRVGSVPALSLSPSAALPELDASSDSVLLRVLTCSLSPGDVKLMTGAMALPRGAAGLPYTPGLEVCGVVEALGAKAAASGHHRVGDRVVAVLRPQSLTGGGLGEYVVAEAALCAAVPASLSSLDAATLPLAGVLAMKVLKSANITAASKVLVLGASSCVGQMVVELAKQVAGAAFVAGTTPNEKLVASLALDQVLVDDSRHEKWYDALKDAQLDVVVDCTGKDAQAWRQADKVLKRTSSSRFVALLGDLASEGDVKATTELLTLGLASMWKTFWRAPKLQVEGQFPTKATMDELLSMVEQRKLTPPVATPLPLTADALLDAVQRVQDPLVPVSGKFVFQVSE